MNPKADFFFNKAKQWKAELEAMREIVLDCGLKEEVKWGCPCYTLDNHNIVLIHAFKEYCAYLFFKGALMSNKHGILIQQTENVQAARQIRFRGLDEIEKLNRVLKDYIFEAIEIEKSGLKVELKKTESFVMAEEFQHKLHAKPKLKAAFESLTPGRQRAYLLYFSSAKQAKTRIDRIEKSEPKIMAGKGLDD